MEILRISEEFDDEDEEDEVEGSVMEQDVLEDKDAQGALSSAAEPFVSARSYFSSYSPYSSWSSSCSVSPSRTPLDQRAIGRDIEVRVSFNWLPFTYEEWYGHLQPTDTWAGTLAQGSSSAELLASYQQGEMRAFSANQVQNAWLASPSEIVLVVKIFRPDGYGDDSYSWNPLRLIRKMRRGRPLGWANNEKNRGKALKIAVADPGVTRAEMLSYKYIRIEGEGIDVTKTLQRFRRKTGLAELVTLADVSVADLDTIHQLNCQNLNVHDHYL